MRQLVSDRRRLGFLAGAVVAGAALFASGVLVANAMGSDDSPGDPGEAGPGVAIDPGSPAGGAGSNTAQPASLPGREDEDMASLSYDRGWGWGGCPAPIPAVLQDGKVDPGLAGFAAKYLGSAFELTGFNVRGQTDCYTDPPSSEIYIVVDTQWKHTETGLDVFVSQRQSSEPVSNVLDLMFASFSKDGYAFSVSVNGYSVQPLDASDKDREPDLPATPGFAPGADPRAGEVLGAALADLGAPESACFYVATNGSLDDLAAAGIGDPRGALPAGYALNHVNFIRYAPPTADCGSPALEDRGGLSFDATWSNGSGFLNISIHEVPEDIEAAAGRLTDGHFAWSNGRYQFFVSGQEGTQSHSQDTLRAIARALDPGFDQRCVVASSPVPIAELDIREPVLPDGFRLEHSYSVRNVATGDCGGVADAKNGFWANWMLASSDQRGIIEVQAGNSPEMSYLGTPNSVTPYGFYWTDANGISYVVNGFKSEFSQDVLIQVATSIDPTFDVTSLAPVDEGAGTSPGSPGVMPLPAEDDKPR